jgi:hypothetical protein
MIRDWKVRWRTQRQGQTAAAAVDPRFERKDLRLHSNLTKAESSLLIQARTGKIGLKAFLFQRQVPGVVSPRCPCNGEKETVYHLVKECEEIRTPRNQSIIKYRNASLRDFRRALGEPSEAAQIVRWIIRTGRLGEYRIAAALAREANEEQWARGLAPEN